MSGRRGFTLLELLIVVLIIGIVGSLSVSMFRAHDADRIEGAMRLLERDLEWARSATLANPDDPAAVRLNADGSGWIVSRNSNPTVAIVADDGTEMNRTLGAGWAEAAEGVRIRGALEARVIEFDSFGGVRQAPTSVEASLPDYSTKCLITFDPGTGNVVKTWSDP